MASKESSKVYGVSAVQLKSKDLRGLKGTFKMYVIDTRTCWQCATDVKQDVIKRHIPRLHRWMDGLLHHFFFVFI